MGGLKIRTVAGAGTDVFPRSSQNSMSFSQQSTSDQHCLSLLPAAELVEHSERT